MHDSLLAYVWFRHVQIHCINWGEPERAPLSLDRHFTSINDKKTNIIPYKFLSDTKVPCSIPNPPYMAVGSSVSRKQYDEVFLNRHIWSLDGQCHEKKCDEVFLSPHIWSLDGQCHENNVTKFS